MQMIHTAPRGTLKPLNINWDRVIVLGALAFFLLVGAGLAAAVAPMP